MSTADGWDLTVPEDETELLAELRRHGVVPGKRFHLVETPPEQEHAAQPAEQGPDERPRRELSFIGSIKDGPSDMARNVDKYLQGFGE